MPRQTNLQVRRDTAANWTSTNPTLASGEIGFETNTLKFKIGNGSTAWNSLVYSQDASLLNGTASITALSTTGDINTAGKLNLTASAGDEGGEIFLSKSVTNTSINTGVVIDVWQNRLRFWESGGTNRGYFLDISAGGTGVGTNIIGTASAVVNTVTGTNSAELVRGNMADNDQFRILVGGTGTNAGFVELATADDGTEPIHVRQYTGVFSTLVRTATLLDGSGNTSFPGTVTAPSFISNVATGTAPFTVSSTTRVANLNVATSGTTSNVLGGATGGILYQSAANTTAFLAAPATNNSILAYNTTTGAPEWDAPPLAMATLTGYTSTATAAGFTSLTNTSSFYQQFTGTTTQTVIMPNTATLITGWTFHIVNNSTGNVTANTFANAATLMVIPANTTAMVTCINTASNTATGWEIGLTDFGTYTGTGSVVMGTLPTITPANAVVATSATQAGYIGMPQNSQSGAYTLAAGDAGKHIYYTTTGQTVTIPNNTTVAFQIGTAITFITAPSVSLSIAITTDTLRLANTTTTGTRTLAANGVATAIKVTSTAWIISGNGLT
jgi:hypothetical protein